MLIISRRLGESITIGENIKLVVTSITPKIVKLGIVAPDNVVIMRDEITNNKKEEKDDRRDND